MKKDILLITQTQVRMHTVSENEIGQRIDNFLLRIWKGVPKSHIYRTLRSGEVRVNRGRVDQTHRLKAGEVIRIPPVKIAERKDHFVPSADFPILHEDDHILVIDKPAGIAVHGGSGVSYGVIEQLRVARPNLSFLELVHRLDRDTSGILMLAKKRAVLVRLHEQIRLGLIDKRYLTLVSGNWVNYRQHIKLPLYKYVTSDGVRRVCVQENGQACHTIFTLKQKFQDFALLEAELKTGRTHQIRVHLSASGFPIVGDDKYGDFDLNHRLNKANEGAGVIKRMFLHACQLRFLHPSSDTHVIIRAPLPNVCTQFLCSLSQF